LRAIAIAIARATAHAPNDPSFPDMFAKAA